MSLVIELFHTSHPKHSISIAFHSWLSMLEINAFGVTQISSDNIAKCTPLGGDVMNRAYTHTHTTYPAGSPHVVIMGAL